MKGDDFPMIKYLICKLQSKITTDDGLIKIANKLKGSVITSNSSLRDAKSLIVSEIKGIQCISNIRFVKLIGTNIQDKTFEILICDTGIISMSKTSTMYKYMDHHKYSIYIKEI